MSYQVQIPNVRNTYFAVDRTEHYQELFWVSLNSPILKKIISSKNLTRRKYTASFIPSSKIVSIPLSIQDYLLVFLNLPFLANFYKLTGMSGTYHYYYYDF